LQKDLRYSKKSEGNGPQFGKDNFNNPNVKEHGGKEGVDKEVRRTHEKNIGYYRLLRCG